LNAIEIFIFQGRGQSFMAECPAPALGLSSGVARGRIERARPDAILDRPEGLSARGKARKPRGKDPKFL